MSELKGFILIDKPCGISSFEVIRRLRKHLGIRKIGHAGTLDPFASGLLI
ncbi:MAG TPA: tRNA pseudouridine(55) synthase TruB, partial [Candidatus Cloacimonadota bacterium]|nr:tRNA pseudouridine(55) synthase TruB [Candidatus Cloacimonadota bacterium]